MENYNWKMKGLAKKVDPSMAAMELQRLQSLYGSLTPEIIVNESKSEDSLLHAIFEWDNDKAGYNYRLQQARQLLNNIQITIISNGESRNIPVFEVTCLKEGYKSINTFTSDDIEFIKKATIQQLNYLKAKLKTYKEFDKVVYFIEQAISEVA